MEITDKERQFLLDLLASAERELISEISHTDTRDYRNLLQAKIGTLQSLRSKIEAVAVLN